MQLDTAWSTILDQYDDLFAQAKRMCPATLANEAKDLFQQAVTNLMARRAYEDFEETDISRVCAYLIWQVKCGIGDHYRHSRINATTAHPQNDSSGSSRGTRMERDDRQQIEFVPLDTDADLPSYHDPRSLKPIEDQEWLEVRKIVSRVIPPDWLDTVYEHFAYEVPMKELAAKHRVRPSTLQARLRSFRSKLQVALREHAVDADLISGNGNVA
jgi:RNA polymerase sigma factor (sigma-70 family)